MDHSSRYEQRGVSSAKTDVHKVVDKLDQGIFPGAFCKITQDFLTNDLARCNVIHADGSGTKSLLAYLHYRETGDVSAFRGIAIDSIVMNLDDLLCVGATQNILISSTINRNPRSIPGDILAALIEGTESFIAQLQGLGIGIYSGGGETADVPDLTNTVTVDSCAAVSLSRSSVIDNANIRPGQVIVGLASSGQASYESHENSGIGSNGLTSARHDMLSSYYKNKYPETFDSSIPVELAYSGPYKLEDPLPGSSLTVGQALLSPTRTYAPVVHRVLQNFPDKVHGMVHCSGGGQAKCLRFGSNIHYTKDKLLPVPPIFQAIQNASNTSTKEMFQVFNMGHRMEFYVDPEFAQLIIDTASSFNIPAQIIGYTEASEAGNSLTIQTDDQEYHYSL